MFHPISRTITHPRTERELQRCGCENESLGRARRGLRNSIASMVRAATVAPTSPQISGQPSNGACQIKRKPTSQAPSQSIASQLLGRSGVQNEACAITDRGQHLNDAHYSPAAAVWNPLLCQRILLSRRIVKYWLKLRFELQLFLFCIAKGVWAWFLNLLLALTIPLWVPCGLGRRNQARTVPTPTT